MNKLFFLLTCFVLFISLSVRAQKISSVDIVKIRAEYEKEGMYFYNENWLAFRKAALEKGVIAGYQLLRSATDSSNRFTLVLITEYADSAYYKRAEENFRPIIKSISPGGPKMLNSVERKQFLEYVSGLDAMTVAEDRNKR